jgi:UrcA family protein
MKGICSTRLATCLSVAALVAAGLTFASDRAFAQQTEQITVVAPLHILGPDDRNPDRVYYTQAVGFADLDLRTDWGVQTLGARIGYAADENCRLLDRYYPDSTTVAAKVTRKQNCVADAVYRAQPQFSAVVFAARQ